MNDLDYALPQSLTQKVEAEGLDLRVLCIQIQPGSLNKLCGFPRTGLIASASSISPERFEQAIALALLWSPHDRDKQQSLLV